MSDSCEPDHVEIASVDWFSRIIGNVWDGFENNQTGVVI